MQEEAKLAVLKTDELEVGDHKISVAISNPPQRRQPLNQQVVSLGRGKTETQRCVDSWRVVALLFSLFIPLARRRHRGG